MYRRAARKAKSWAESDRIRDELVAMGIQLKDGKILATWGKQGLGPSEFDWVHGIVVDSKGAVYAADTYGQRMQKFEPTSSSR